MRQTNTMKDRQARVDQALKIITSRTTDEKDKVVSMLCVNLGVSERKAKEYIRVLAQSGKLNKTLRAKFGV